VATALGLLGALAILLAPVDTETWHHSIDPARCDSTAVVELPKWTKWIYHRLVPGESLAEIAARYGLREADLRAHNGISPSTEKLRVGTRLHVKARRIPPPRAAVTHTVAATDTWISIARRHGVDAKELRAYNWPWKDKLREGTALTVWVDPIATAWIAAAPDDHGIARGGLGVGAPDVGHLVGGVAIPPGDGYALRFPDSAYGTSHAVAELVRALGLHRESTSYTGVIGLGSMSRPRGGPLGKHRSHQTGRDIDIQLPRRTDVPAWLPLTPRRVDWRAVWDLAVAFAEVDATVVYLDYALQRELYRAMKAAGIAPDELARILQYPRGWAAHRGLVRHEPGHTAHLHVRFGCGPCEVECIELGAWAEASEPTE
jgi:murein endopeptidase/LysM repeat protein